MAQLIYAPLSHTHYRYQVGMLKVQYIGNKTVLKKGDEYFPPVQVLAMESTSYVCPFRMVFFLPCDHGLDY